MFRLVICGERNLILAQGAVLHFEGVAEDRSGARDDPVAFQVLQRIDDIDVPGVALGESSRSHGGEENLQPDSVRFGAEVHRTQFIRKVRV